MRRYPLNLSASARPFRGDHARRPPSLRLISETKKVFETENYQYSQIFSPPAQLAIPGKRLRRESAPSPRLTNLVRMHFPFFIKLMHECVDAIHMPPGMRNIFQYKAAKLYIPESFAAYHRANFKKPDV